MNAPLLADVRSHLSAWEERWGAPDEREATALADARAALEQQPPALLRHPHRTHITCSAFVFSPDLRRTLLVHHLKGNFWVQPGGLPEDGDASVIAAALRETLEETGVRPVGRATVLDLDHHGLSGAFGHCRSHLDLGVAVTADPAAQLLVSDESADVGWFGVDALPELLPSNFAARLARIAERAGRF